MEKKVLIKVRNKSYYQKFERINTKTVCILHTKMKNHIYEIFFITNNEFF